MGKLSKLKSDSKNSLKQLQAQAQEEKSGPRDSRFWKPGFDSEKKTGGARIRFLPPPEDEKYGWVKMFSHFFKGDSGKVYAENSLTTIGKNDPVSEMNRRLWATEIKSDQNLVSNNTKRKMKYISNVLVIDDPYNRENEGKVFLFEYGKKIHDKILEQMGMKARDELDEADDFNPLDFWEGANFRIKIVQNGPKPRDRNYDNSHFESQSQLFDGDEDKLEEIWSKQHSLEDFYAESNFEDYEVLQKRLFEVLGATVGSGVEVVEGWSKSDGSAGSNSTSDKGSDKSISGSGAGSNTRERLNKSADDEADGADDEQALNSLLDDENDSDDKKEPSTSAVDEDEKIPDSDNDSDDDGFGFLGDEFG